MLFAYMQVITQKGHKQRITINNSELATLAVCLQANSVFRSAPALHRGTPGLLPKRARGTTTR